MPYNISIYTGNTMFPHHPISGTRCIAINFSYADDGFGNMLFIPLASFITAHSKHWYDSDAWQNINVEDEEYDLEGEH